MVLRNTGQDAFLLEFACFFIRWELQALGGKSLRLSAIFITSYQWYALSAGFVTVDVDLGHLAEAVPACFSSVKSLFSPFHAVLLGHRSLCTVRT